MQKIDTLASLDAVANPSLCPILERYRDMMDLAVIYIVQPSDTLADLCEWRGRAFADWEFIIDHPSGWYEAVTIISDDGAGDVVLVPNGPGTDPELLSLCRDNAEVAADGMN